MHSTVSRFSRECSSRFGVLKHFLLARNQTTAGSILYIVQLPLRNATPITVVKSPSTTGREDYRILTLQRPGRRKISVCHCPIRHNFSNVRTLPTVAAKAGRRGILRQRLGR